MNSPDILKDEISSIIKERIDNFESNQHEPKRERGITITTMKNQCFNAAQAAILAQAAIPIQPIQVISRDDLLKQDIPDLPLEYDVDFNWNYQKNNSKPYKVKTEVDNRKIQQAIAKRAKKLRQKELYHESIKKNSRIWKNKSR